MAVNAESPWAAGAAQEAAEDPQAEYDRLQPRRGGSGQEAGQRRFSCEDEAHRVQEAFTRRIVAEAQELGVRVVAGVFVEHPGDPGCLDVGICGSNNDVARLLRVLASDPGVAAAVMAAQIEEMAAKTGEKN